MSDVSSSKSGQTQEMMNKRQTFELRKIGDNYEKELKEVREKNEKEITKVKKDYDVQLNKEKNDADIKLTKVRNSYSNRIEQETKRFEKLMSDLKQSQTDRLAEMQMSNEQQINGQELKHREYLEKARQKFEEEKAKIEA